MLEECLGCLSRLARIAVAAVLLVAGGCVTGGDPAPTPVTRSPWHEEGLTGRRFETDHFEIHSTLTDTEFEAALPDFLERVHKRYEETIPPSSETETKLTTYVFNTRSHWTRFARQRFPNRYGLYSRIRSGGFTEGALSASFCTNRSETLATLAHEGWHQYVNLRSGAAMPAWLNEGLACYHEAIDFAGPKPRFTPEHNTFRVNSLRDAIQQDNLMSLREIISTDAGRIIDRESAEVVQIYYAQAWALVTYLRHGAAGQHAAAFDRMLHDVADGTLPARVSAARLHTSDAHDMSGGEALLKAYFDCSPDEMADEYYDHIVRITGF